MPFRQLVSTLGLAALFAFAPPASGQHRIVSTDAAATEILFALGVDSQLVAVDVSSQLPSGYRALPRVGYHRALSAEGLLALHPDLLVGSTLAGPPQALSALSATGTTLLLRQTAYSVAELKSNVSAIAAAVGETARGAQLLAAIDLQAAAFARKPLDGQPAAFILSAKPGSLRIAGRGTAGAAFIALLGASNIADFDGYRSLSAEALLALDPALLLVANLEGGSPEQAVALNPVLGYGRAAQAGQILPVAAETLVSGLSLGAVRDAVRLAEQLNTAMAAD